MMARFFMEARAQDTSASCVVWHALPGFQAAVAKDRIEAFLLSPEARLGVSGSHPLPWLTADGCGLLGCRSRHVPRLQSRQGKLSRSRHPSSSGRSLELGMRRSAGREPQPSSVALCAQGQTRPFFWRRQNQQTFSQVWFGSCCSYCSAVYFFQREVEISVTQGEMLVIVGKTGAAARRCGSWGVGVLDSHN